MPPASIAVTLYGRPGCTLCDEAELAIRRFAKQIPLELILVNIEEDDDVLRRYMFEIPVVTLNGREIARAPIRYTHLQDALEEAAGLA